MEIHSSSPEETQKLAGELALKIKPGTLITLSGDLGSGKTTFVQGFAHALGIKQRLLSPTFVFVHLYHYARQAEQHTLYHVDLYRIQSEHEVISLDLVAMLRDPRGIVVVEWPERAMSLFTKCVKVSFVIMNENTRRISIEGI